MSETHVQGTAEHAAVVVTAKNSNNNNEDGNKKCKNNNKNNNEINDSINKTQTNLNNNDEIIEEFDFSDSELEELGKSDEDDNNNNDDDEEEDESKNSKSHIDIVDNNNVHSTEHNNTASDKTNTKAIDVDKECGTGVASVGDKRKHVPANLQLPAMPTATATTANDPYCPITPRRIMDIESEDAAEPQQQLLMRSGTQNSVRAANNQNSEGDDNADDDFDEENPDEELLVQFLGEANRIAEARLAARRQARAEAREIRMRELERQQKEQEHNADRVFDMQTASGIDPLSRTRLNAGLGSSPLNSTRGNSMSSRRSSEDSLEEEGRSLRDIRHELKDVEERFRKAMIANAQLDNERASQTYQIQLLKDKLEEMEESYAQLQREFKEKSRDCNALKRNLDKLSEELKLVQGQLNERDMLIAEQGLVIVAVENEDGTDAKRALVSVENAQLLGSVQGSLDVRLKKFGEEKQQLMSEVQKLQEQLENYKSQGKGRGTTLNGPMSAEEDYEAQREANKIISDYKYKLQKAEQEIASLQASLARSETQVIRYKSTAEAAEKAEAELKIERRKLQRENREAMERLEELETSNNHLLKRLDKLKNAKSALLKDL